MKELFTCSDNARKIFDNRYSNLKADGTYETPVEIMQRVSKAVADVEKKYRKSIYYASPEVLEDEYFSLMASKKFIPAGRTLRNAGGETPLIPNCLVLHFHDSMDGITETLKLGALHQQVGCGLGFPFHFLRPACVQAKRTQGQASGPVSFLRAFDSFFGTIKQQSRHGANMATFHIEHPDIYDFIHCKKNEGSLKNFNISVLLTDAFMEEALAQFNGAPHTPWITKWKGQEFKVREVKRNAWGMTTGVEERVMSALDILRDIASSAWRNGEPGVLFYDRLQETNPLKYKGTIEATNPCAEQALHDGANCNLGSMNLAAFWNAEKNEFDFVAFAKAVILSVRFLDNVIDLMTFPHPKTAATAVEERRVGLGIMGLADLLLLAKLPYDVSNPQTNSLLTAIMQLFQRSSHMASEKLAEEKGPFPGFWQSEFTHPRRNAMITTIAPSGSISLCLDVCGGIEPYFALQYKQEQILNGQDLKHVTPVLQSLHDEVHLSEPEWQVIKETGSVQTITRIPAHLREVYKTAMDIPPVAHIEMQALIQQYVDNSISKTINLAEDASVQDIVHAWFMGWEKKLKSMTVYRNNSRKVQVLSLESKPNHEEQLFEQNKCPVCDETLIFSEGCILCPHCGGGKCSL